MNVTTSEIAPGVIEIDTMLGGWSKTTAGYLLTGPAPVLIETGSQSSIEVVLACLESLGLGAEDLAGIAVTHIHLDHAGGVGDVARAFPSATVYVHELGARHLADPSRLIASASMVYGTLLDELYGRLDPTPADRIRVLKDGDTVDLGGGRTLSAIDSPGHAKHHLGFLDSETGTLFSGDAVGIRLPFGEALLPTTPPPDFDLDVALSSMQRFLDKSPTAVAFAHYGLISTPPDELLDDAAHTLRAWAHEATRAYHEGRDIAAALALAFRNEIAGLEPEVRSRFEMLGGVHSNAAGLKRWIEKLGGPPGSPVA